MLHQIKLPTYDQSLELIVQAQQKMIAFACDPNTPLTPSEDDFKQIFGDQVGVWMYQWLQRKKGNSTYYEGFCKLLECIDKQPTLRKELVDDFKHDIDFFTHLNDASFVFLFNTSLQKEPRHIIAPLMIVFYDDLFYSGFPQYIVEFDRKKFLRFFWDSNEALGVCPACDAPRPDINEQYIHSDIDHFFPKSLYPFLSMHAANLVPLCTDCNRYVKRDEDPVDQQRSAPLENIFHPFGKPALSSIKVAVSRNAKGEYQVSIEEAAGGKSRRVDSLNRVYDLEVRWFERLKAEIESIRKKIKNAGKRFLQKGVSADDIVDILLREILDDYDQKIGVEHFYVLRGSYACYALNDSEELATLVEMLS